MIHIPTCLHCWENILVLISARVIVGIAKDFNFNSLHHKIETMFMFNQTDWGFGNMSVKINGNKPKEAIAFIQSVWQKDCPGLPFEYQFLNEHFEELYQADSQISTIVGTLADTRYYYFLSWFIWPCFLLSRKKNKGSRYQESIGCIPATNRADAFKRFFKICFDSCFDCMAGVMVGSS